MQESSLTLIEVANQYPQKWLLLYAVDIIAEDEQGKLDYKEVGQFIYEGGRVPLERSKFPVAEVHFGRLVGEFPPLITVENS